MGRGGHQPGARRGAGVLTGGSAPPGQMTFAWTGTVPPQKWMNFYTKVVSKHAANSGLRPTVTFEVPVSADEARTREQETRAALRELGLDENASAH